MASKQETVRLLRDEARVAVDSRRHTQALQAFTKLEALEPADPDWPRRAAECHAALKKPKEQAEALARAAERFDKARVAKKAEALCRLSLVIDPANARARSLLDGLEHLGEQTRSVGLLQPLAATAAAPEPLRQNERPPAPARLDAAMRDRHKNAARVASKK
jgi:hypothetical protein